MKCTRVTASPTELLDPAAGNWSTIPGEEIKMDATPLANQPSEYIKASRDEKTIGKVRKLTVQAAHDGAQVFFRLTWEDATKDVAITDINVFPDACGILMPITGRDTPIDEMGSNDDPVNAWFWRADRKDEPRNVVAKGLSTTRDTKQCAIKTKSKWENGTWSVVFTRPLAVPEQKDEAVQLDVGKTVKIGFAVWEGSNSERAGVKSFSKEWRELTFAA
jgi:DMSO reductase family type II enzyme heme b subunit